MTQCTADKAGKLWFGAKRCRSLRLQRVWNKTFCLGSSARASALLTEAHGITRRGAINSTALIRWKATASLFTLPHVRLPETDFSRDWKNEAKTRSPRRRGRALLFRVHSTSLWPAPIWYSTILLKQQILTNVLRDMWWGKGCFHWEEAKLIFPIWWYHY